MAQPGGARSAMATVVGYVLLGVLALFLLQVFIGTIVWLLRTILIVAVIGGLLTLYLRLKLPKD